LDKFKKLSSPQKAQCILEKAKYLTRKGKSPKKIRDSIFSFLDEARTRWLTLWLVADLDSKEGQKLVLNAIKFLKKSSDARVAVLHNGRSDSKTARFIKFILENLSTEDCKLILQKVVQDTKWLKSVEADLSMLKEIVGKVIELFDCFFNKIFSEWMN
jgi:hypothetical protein